MSAPSEESADSTGAAFPKKPAPAFFSGEISVDISTRHIWQIAWPVLVSALMQHLIGLVDTAFLGRVGEIELGAAAIGSIYFLALFMLGFGFSIGSQILIGQRNGARKFRSIGRIFLSSASFLLMLALGICLLSKLFTPRLLPLFIRSEAVCNAALTYLDWRIYGLFFSFAGVLFRAFFVGITRTRVLTINALIMTLSNVVLNYLLIFGKFGCPEMGIAGAAIASVAAEAISLLFYLLYVKFRVNTAQYGLAEAKFFDRLILLRVFNISVWTMLQSFFAVGVWFYFFVVIEHLGERPLAVVNLVRSVSSILFMLINAFAVTASSLASNLIGAGESQRIPGLTWKVTGIAYAALLPPLLFSVIFPELVLRIYTDNPELIAASCSTLYVMAVGHMLQAPANVWFNVVSGVGKTRAALGIELFTLLVYTIAVYIIGQLLRLNVAWCWTTEILYPAVILALSFGYLKRCLRQGKNLEV